MPIVRLVLALTLCASCIQVPAMEVTLNHQNTLLNADFTRANDQRTATMAVLVTHGGLAHRDMETIKYLRELLHKRGYNVLAINLSLGLNNRHGMYNCDIPHQHLNRDAVNEIGIWVEWLKTQGIQSVILLGHSRGGAQTALYAVEQDRDLIGGVVLLAPATAENTSAAHYQQRYGQSLIPLLQQAKQLLSLGKGSAILKSAGLMSCRSTLATAATIFSYYGQTPDLDTPYLLAKIKKPTVVVVAGNDETVINLEEKLVAYHAHEQIQVAVIDGADHMFRDLYADDAVDVIDRFIRSLGANRNNTHSSLSP